MFGDSSEQDLEFITLIHDQIIDESGGSKGYHDVNLVKSALARPIQSAMGKDAYSNLFEKAAALLDSIANNHGFRDGNKRTAMAAAIYYLFLNNLLVTITDEEYETVMLNVVNDKPDIAEIASWLKAHAMEFKPMSNAN
jgi:death-on-curing protein